MTDIAIVGIGNWGQNLVRTFDDIASVRAACHTGTDAHADWLAEHYPDVDRTTDYEAVLADDGIDAVAFATPIPTLADLVERALEAGKHVYVEKPMAATLDGAERLAALAEERDRTLFVGYIFVHHPVFSAARGRVREEGADYVRFEWHTEGSFGPGLVNNLACHPVSVAVAALGVPEAVDVVDRRAVVGDVDVLSCRLEYRDVDCDVIVDRLSPRKEYAMTAFTAAGGAYVATDDRLYAFDREAASYEVASAPDPDPLGTECRNFIRAIETGETPETDGRFGVRVHEVLAEIKART